MKRLLGICIVAACVGLCGCAGAPPVVAHEPADTGEGVGGETIDAEGPGDAAPADTDDAGGLMDVFPHVRVDTLRGVVEFDGIVPLDCHDPETPDVYLELVACTRGTREHESLVMTEAKPSHVHAALLLAGFEPGSPGGLGGRAADGSRVAASDPRGDPVRVTIVYEDAEGRTTETDAAEMIAHIDTGARIETAGWVFGGSAFVEYRENEFYDADGTGLLIGLATFGAPHLDGPTFGGETIGLAEVFSPEAAVAEPVWVADAARVPAYLTRVVVRLSRPE